MIPVFIQTDGKVIDVSKIVFIDIPDKGNPTILFTSGQTIELSPDETDALLNGMVQVAGHRPTAGALVTHRAPSHRREPVKNKTRSRVTGGLT